MGKFIIKKIQQNTLKKIKVNSINPIIENNNLNNSEKNNIKKNINMNTEDKIEKVQEVLGTNNVKHIKKNKGLIEKVDTKIILTEDNKQLLVD